MRPITEIAALWQRRHFGVPPGGVGGGGFRGWLLCIVKTTEIL
jgi:hypothetical protein